LTAQQKGQLASPDASVVLSVVIAENRAFIPPVVADAPIMIASDINPTMKPYSMALDPLSSPKSRTNFATVTPADCPRA
jgi:hypothetical protein